MPRKTQRTQSHLTHLYAQHCGRSHEEVERALAHDTFMTVEEALEWGLIDRVLDPRAEEQVISTEL